MYPSTNGTRFPRQIYPLRLLGCTLGLPVVAFGLQPQPAFLILLIPLLIQALAWPHLAYALSRRARKPRQQELIHLRLDNLSGGFWVVAIGLNPLPSTLMLSFYALSSIATEGWRGFWRGLLAQLVGALLGWLLLGLHWQTETSPIQLLACLPILAIYPLGVGLMTYRLARTLHQQKQELLALSQTDGLTGLGNRRHWEERLQQHQTAHACLLLLDVDHFKRLNDSYGHSTGDQVLRQLASLLRRQFGEPHVLGRFGGEEFGVLLLHTSLNDAYNQALTLLNSVSTTLKVNGVNTPITVSIGLTQWDPRFAQVDQWLDATDSALYRAKRCGRNRLEIGYYLPSRLSITSSLSQSLGLFRTPAPYDNEALEARSG